MCFPCIQHLVSVYNFKTRCLNTETIIRSYIQRNNLAEYNHVNLNCVVQELIRINNYFRDMHHRKIDGDKQSMEVCPQNPRGIPRIPYGTPQGIPGHFKISENQGKLENPTDHVAPSIQGVMRDLSPERTRNEFISEGQHILTHRGMEGQQRILPVSPIQVGTQDKDRVVLSQGTEENRDNVDGTNSSIEQDSNCGNQSSKPESESSGNSEDMEKKDERCSDEIDKTATSRNNNNSSYPFRLETHKENRPRLIIKICKNKITIPSNKNEDSSEKENEKMDVEMNEIEMLVTFTYLLFLAIHIFYLLYNSNI